VTITASIKSKFAASPEVSALSIDVDTTDGRVTLSGKVNSAEEVNRAVEIASTVEGVRQVISTLLIDSGTSASDPGS
jgi:hyperosmotically inducible protein